VARRSDCSECLGQFSPAVTRTAGFLDELVLPQAESKPQLVNGTESDQGICVQSLLPELLDSRGWPAGHTASGGTMTTG
jgi:hypothetical protein